MRAFVVGNGPSLKAEQLDKLHKNNEASFGVNRIHLIYDQTKWRPSHWVMMDFSNSLRYQGDIRIHSTEGYPCHIRADITAKFLEWCIREKSWPFLENLNILKKCNHIDAERYTADEWHESVCQMGGSVPAAIQVAVQMGYNPIYTIGMDGDKKGSAENNFIAGYIDVDAMTVEKAALANKTTELALRIAKRECNDRGIKLIDATVGGSAYKALPEVDFYELFD